MGVVTYIVWIAWIVTFMVEDGQSFGQSYFLIKFPSLCEADRLLSVSSSSLFLCISFLKARKTSFQCFGL